MPVVILDIWMEEMSGLELQARLSVIVITGRDDPAAKLTALQLGVIAVFTKPFDDDQFLNAVRGDLAARATAMAIGPAAFFIKPFNDEKFLAAVHDALARHRTRDVPFLQPKKNDQEGAPRVR